MTHLRHRDYEQSRGIRGSAFTIWWGASIISLPALLALGCNNRADRPAGPPSESAIAPAHSTSESVQAPAASELKAGAPAPDVTLTLQDGFQLPLLSEKGKPVAVYFCSSDENPDCLREAHGLRDHWSALHKHHVVVVGVSARDASSHRAFIAEHKLPFDLATDADGHIAQAFKVPTRGEYSPRTFLIGSDGKLRGVWQTANPEALVQEILAAVE
ncbi:redoxin domain-containing protein [Pendulispora brunnea]|uniref:thioredoxin-dependent peroxiredoxin n=1 Tax=Pendulispora brunnea TaxID=2905690 RepID=A0ABZ2KDT2_9BACT